MAAAGPRGALALRINQRFFYGWAMLSVASGPGQSHTFSVFIGPIGEKLGISATAVSSAYGLATLAAAIGVPHLGRLVDRHGVRRVLIAVASLFGIAQIPSAGSAEWWRWRSASPCCAFSARAR